MAGLSSKSYLKYEGRGDDCCLGVICGGEGGPVLHPQGGGLAFCPTLDHISVWDLRRGGLVRRLKGAEGAAAVGRVTQVALNRDGSLVAAGHSDGVVRLYVAADGELKVSLAGHRGSVTAASFGPSGSLLATGGVDGDVVVWDVTAESGLRRLRGHVGGITDLVFVGEGLLISSSKDCLVKVWDVDSGTCAQTLVGHRSEVWSLDVDASGSLLVSGASDGHLRVFSASTFEPMGSVKRLTSERALRVRFGGGGLLVVQAGARSLEQYRVRSPEEAEKRRRRRRKRAREKSKEEDADVDAAADLALTAADWIEGLRVTPVGGKLKSFSLLRNPKGARALVSLANNSLELWKLCGEGDGEEEEPAARQSTLDLHGHRSDVRAVALSSDQLLVATAGGSAVKFWSVLGRQHVRTATLKAQQPLCLTFAPGDGHLVVGTKGGAVVVVRVGSGEVVWEDAEAHGGAVWGVILQPGGAAVASCSADGSVKMWELELGAGGDLSLVHTRTLKAAEDVLCVAFTSGRGAGKGLLAVGLLDNTIKVFHEDSLRFFLNLYGHSLPVLSLDMSDDGALLASGGADRTLKIWGLDFGDCHRSLSAHDDSITSVRFLPRSHHILTAGKDSRIVYWDGDTFQKVAVVGQHLSEVWALTTSKDGGLLISAGHDRSIRVWERTDEPVFPSEEAEKEMEAAFDAGLETAAPANETEAALPTRRTIESVAAGERLLEALTGTEMAEMLGLSHSAYLLRTLCMIKPGDLEQALLVLPFSSVAPMADALAGLLRQGREVELCCRCAIFLLKSHQGRITSSGMAAPVRALRAAMRAQLEAARDSMGVNMAALRLLGAGAKRHAGQEVEGEGAGDAEMV